MNRTIQLSFWDAWIFLAAAYIKAEASHGLSTKRVKILPQYKFQLPLQKDLKNGIVDETLAHSL
jgi:hypothetical protein